MSSGRAGPQPHPGERRSMRFDSAGRFADALTRPTRCDKIDVFAESARSAGGLRGRDEGTLVSAQGDDLEAGVIALD